ncbi:MAG: GatB/YqeY domain-containing protein [Bacteroidetes bacterium]|nr:GatB/YqeY domain-containing protein [Bacteroidota bacterium]
MSLKDQLSHDLKEAMRAKDRVRLGAIRMLSAAILEKEKSGGGDVTEDDLVAIVQKQAKQRRDSIRQFREGGRNDLVDIEEAELAVIEHYLPAQLSDEEIRTTVQQIVEQTGASEMQDMGRVMGQAMQTLRGKADGNRVRQAVEALLKN